MNSVLILFWATKKLNPPPAKQCKSGSLPIYSTGTKLSQFEVPKKLEEHHSPLASPPLSTEKYNLTFLLRWSTRFLQKLRDFLKSTRKTRAGNRSDHLHRRKRNFENLFSSLLALATPFSQGRHSSRRDPDVKRVSEKFRTRNKMGRRTNQTRSQDSASGVQKRGRLRHPEHAPYIAEDGIGKTLSLREL